MIAPTTAIASRALVSDISGVCSSGDTRRITSKPMNAASMKTYRLVIRVDAFISSASSVMAAIAGSAKNSRTRAFTISPPRVSERVADDLVVQVQVELSVLHEVKRGRRDVLRVHLAGVIRHRAGQVDRSR